MAKRFSFEEFVETVKTNIANSLPENATVIVNKVLKTNNTGYTGLTIHYVGSTISPTIALEPYYHDEYMAGNTIGAICKDIMKRADIINPEMMDTIQMSELFKQKDYVSNRVIMQFVNTEWNKDLLQDVPHRMWNDLAIVYRVFVGHGTGGMSTFLLHNSHLDMYSVTEEELFEFAYRNTRSILPATIKTMDQLMEQMLVTEGYDAETVEEMVENIRNAPNTMYVVTNNIAVHGAVNILYTDVLENIAAEIGGDLYILPSSVHECIIVNANAMPIDEAKSMVKMVNTNEVAADEVLSDNVYFFDAKTKEVKML